MRFYRIGLIGLGGMAQAHIRWMNEQERLVLTAISDVSEDALHRTGDELRIPTDKRYIDYMQLIEDPGIDAIVSATPNNVHAEIVRACLTAGKPFLAEKPFTRVFEEAVPLMEQYANRPVPSMFGFTYRYTPAFRYARELIRSGQIGALRSFSIQYLQGWGAASKQVPYVWRFDKEITGTGTLGDLGSHMIDMARFLVGEFEELSAQLHTIVPERPDPVTGKPIKIEVDDYASFQARMSGDVRGIFQTTRNAVGSGNQHEVSVYGDNGTIHASTLDPDRLVWIREEEKGQVARLTLDVPAGCRTKLYADFLSLLDGEVPDGLPNFIDAYRNQQILDAIIRANLSKMSILV
jgi:predicted dehydrogenase